MRVEYTGRQTEVTPAIRALAERKLAKLTKVLHGVTHAHVILVSEKYRQIAEVSVHSRHLTLTAAESTADLEVSLATVIEKLTRQAHHHLGKLQERKRRSKSRSLLPPPSENRPEVGPRIIKTRLFAVKPMSVDEAVVRVKASDECLLVFRDEATERVNVLYKRRDGNLGLVEPEA
jgi:putative sigma-54 modulation protein